MEIAQVVAVFFAAWSGLLIHTKGQIGVSVHAVEFAVFAASVTVITAPYLLA